MIVLLKKSASRAEIENFSAWLKNLGFDTHLSVGSNQTIMGLVGDTSAVDIETIKALEIVEDVKRIQEPFKNANRKFHEDDTVVELPGRIRIGGGHFQVIAGPCSVESEEQIVAVARAVQAAGATILRGGAFKPRTSPYAFQGLQEEGLRLLLLAKKVTGLPVVSEIMDPAHIPLFDEVDMIQVGARNMQNFELLKHLGQLRKPILLKRGLANTLQELLMSAEYIMAGGNEQVVLCERGIRTFETYTRNTLDLSAIPVLHGLTHLPVIIDPSHATGYARLVKPMALAATAAGADGLIVEVHNDPTHALCDGPQSLTPESFDDLMRRVSAIRPFVASPRQERAEKAVGIVGLGLIGGSMAKALKPYGDLRVYGYDAAPEVLDAALDTGAIDGRLSREALAACDVVIVALYPDDAIAYVRGHAHQFKPGSIVMDCCGVKRPVCDALKEVAHQAGFTFIGGHPMAGVERFGFSSSFAELFSNASLILTPEEDTPAAALERLRELATRLGFTHVELTTPERHDRMIAYTSQLAHVVSCAYVGSPLAAEFQGFSAGSFRDMTRVARLNETMWSDLFLKNQEYLCAETESLIVRLQELSEAIRAGDRDKLRGLLRRARETKEEIEAE